MSPRNNTGRQITRKDDRTVSCRNNFPFSEWQTGFEHGLEQYTQANCDRAERVAMFFRFWPRWNPKQTYMHVPICGEVQCLWPPHNRLVSMPPHTVTDMAAQPLSIWGIRNEKGIRMIPIGVRVLVVAAMAGFIVPVDALADCPELEQLQSAYFEASQHISQHSRKLLLGERPPPPTRELCESYRRLSEATKAWVEYARQTGALCRFSGLMPMMEREYNKAVEARDNVCSGRPVRPGFSFPAEIMR